MKYHFAYVDHVTSKLIVEYDTDAEPPRIGDFFQPFAITNEKDTNTYRVMNVYHIPEDLTLTGIVIEIKIER